MTKNAEKTVKNVKKTGEKKSKVCKNRVKTVKNIEKWPKCRKTLKRVSKCGIP